MPSPEPTSSSREHLLLVLLGLLGAVGFALLYPKVQASAQLGLEVGRLLFRSGRPRAYAQGGYRHSFLEKTGDTSLRFSDAFLELGYLAHPRLTLRGIGTYRTSHGGIDWIEVLQGHADFHNHDQVAAAKWLRAGVGLSTPIGAGVDLFASVAKTIEGENTHDGTTFSLGTSWDFQAPGYGRTKIRFPD